MSEYLIIEHQFLTHSVLFTRNIYLLVTLRRYQSRKKVIKNTELGGHIWKVKGNELDLKGGNDISRKEVNKEKSRSSRHKEMVAEMITMTQLPENGLQVITSKKIFQALQWLEACFSTVPHWGVESRALYVPLLIPLCYWVLYLSV